MKSTITTLILLLNIIGLGSLGASSTALAELVRVQKIDDGVYRGSAPVTPEDYDTLKKMGIKTLLDLRIHWRFDPNDRIHAEQNGFIYKDTPVPLLTKTPDSIILEALKIIETKELQPVYIHCNLGRDRTGLISSLYRIEMQGWDPQRAYDEWVYFGLIKWNLGMMPTFRAWTGSDPVDRKDCRLHNAFFTGKSLDQSLGMCEKLK